MNWDKTLIMFYGRCGSSLVADTIRNNNNILMNPNEIASELHRDNFLDNIYKLDDYERWVIKLHWNTALLRTSDNTGAVMLCYLLDTIKPSQIVWTYRKDIYDTFLSYAIAYNTKTWNGSERSDIKPVYLEHLDILSAAMEYSFETMMPCQDVLFDRYNIIPVEYEETITTKMFADQQLNTTLVKQNDRKQKHDIIVNIEEVNKHFDERLSKYKFTDEGKITLK